MRKKRSDPKVKEKEADFKRQSKETSKSKGKRGAGQKT